MPVGLTHHERLHQCILYYFHPKAKLLYLLMAIGNAAVYAGYTDAKDIGHLFL
jgi:hypothetical protein